MSNLPAIFDQLPDDFEALSAGLTGGFAVVSIRSGRFRVKYQGTEQVITGPDGHPLSALEVFIVKASPAISKTFYERGYEEGSDTPPDCFSHDGIAPDLAAPKPQCDVCARCPKNVFGSRITESGQKVKACQDNRRLAVVPANDIKNEAFGGPMLLRVPPSSLGNLADYGRKLQQRGYKYAAIVTEISFDMQASYPKLVFRPKRIADQTEVPLIVEQVRNPTTDLICHTASTEEYGGRQPVQPTPQSQPAPQLEQIPAQTILQPQVVQPQPAQQPVQQPDPFDALARPASPAAAPQPQPQPTQQSDPFDVLQQPAQQAAPAPAPQPQKSKTKSEAAPAPAATPAPAQAQVSEDPSGDSLEQDIKNLLATLD